jgi:hypothetical protein
VIRLDLARYRVKIDRVLRANRAAVERLFTSGTLFSRQGLATSRELLSAHEQLLRVIAIIDQLHHQGDVPAPRRAEEIAAMVEELEQLLLRTDELSAQTDFALEQLERNDSPTR